MKTMNGSDGHTTKQPSYSPEHMAELKNLRQALNKHMAVCKPQRYAHSLSVATTAASLALVYGVDPYPANCAGILHDWDKVLTSNQQIERARALGIDLGVDMALVANLLHGLIAAKELPAIFPELPSCVWQAISRHTTGAMDMTDLDMVVFVADGIEPLRKETPGIKKLRSLVGKLSLSELYRQSFVSGIIYVLESGRYLYPATLEIYNALALKGEMATC